MTQYAPLVKLTSQGELNVNFNVLLSDTSRDLGETTPGYYNELQVYALIRLYEAYANVYTGKRIDLLAGDNPMYEPYVDRFRKVAAISQGKDPRRFFTALYDCKSLYVTVKGHSLPDLERLLDDKVIRKYVYGENWDTKFSFTYNERIAGTTDLMVNLWYELYQYAIGQVIPNSPYENLARQLHERGMTKYDLDVYRATKPYYEHEELQQFLANVLYYQTSVFYCPRVQTYLRGFSLKEVSAWQRRQICQVGSFLGLLNDYKLLKQYDIPLDKEGRLEIGWIITTAIVPSNGRYQV